MIRVDLKQYEKASPTDRLLTLVLAIAGRDKASEIRFDYRKDLLALRVWYWVRDELLELAPPPAWAWSALLQILLKETKTSVAKKRPSLNGMRRRPSFPNFPLAGKLRVRFGEQTIEFDVLFFRGRTGEHIWIERESNVDVSAYCKDFFKQWHAAGHGPKNYK